jgi:hypothetical protein
MNPILQLLFIFLACVLIKLFYNAYYYCLAKSYFAKFNQYLKNAVDDKSDWTIQENKHKIINIFLHAGLKDTTLSVIEPGGYGLVKTINISLFDNIPLLRNDIPSIVVQFFKESIGVFRNRMVDAVNPIYWLESLVFLPKKIFNYLGVSADSLFIRSFQVIWWLIVAAGTIIGIVFNPEFRAWLSTHL